MAKTIKGVGKLTKARSMLLMVQPWYGVPALSLRLVPRENDPILWAMGTDGHNLFFNPDWVMDATLDEIMGVIVHEIWHIWSKHDIRRGAREHRKFNIAADYSINPIIRSAGYKLPVGALGDEYAGKAAEEIYAKLPEPPKGGGSGDGGKDWDVGHVYDNPDLAQGRPVKDVEAERNMKISNWHQSAKRAGKVPAELDRIVEEMMKARMPWREILARFVNTSACNDYDHTIPDPEYARYGVYMPSMHSEELGTIVHMGDTSGSISTDMFKIEVAEAQGMLRAYPGAQMLCLWIDTKVHNPEWITADDIPLQIHPAGGGGTSFVPGFTYLVENDIVPVCIIYATDGQCEDFPDDPGVPVLWLVIEDNESFNPPFGEVVRCDFE